VKIAVFFCPPVLGFLIKLSWGERPCHKRGTIKFANTETGLMQGNNGTWVIMVSASAQQDPELSLQEPAQSGAARAELGRKLNNFYVSHLNGGQRWIMSIVMTRSACRRSRRHAVRAPEQADPRQVGAPVR
jgi:hypothetical protein